MNLELIRSPNELAVALLPHVEDLIEQAQALTTAPFPQQLAWLHLQERTIWRTLANNGWLTVPDLQAGVLVGDSEGAALEVDLPGEYVHAHSTAVRYLRLLGRRLQVLLQGALRFRPARGEQADDTDRTVETSRLAREAMQRILPVESLARLALSEANQSGLHNAF